MKDNILKIILGLIFLISLTQFSIDLSLKQVNIPITGQSLAVLVVAGILGAKWGRLTIGLYLILGGFGLPIFANSGSGWEVFGKGSGGFLYGFLIVGAIVGWLSNQWGIAKFGRNIGLMTIGTALILVFGVGHLTVKYGLEKALEYGFYPFWPGAIIKIIVGAIILTLWYRMSNKIKV